MGRNLTAGVHTHRIDQSPCWVLLKLRQNRTHSAILAGATKPGAAAFKLNPDSRNLSSRLSLPLVVSITAIKRPLVEARLPTNHDAIASIRNCSYNNHIFAIGLPDKFAFSSYDQGGKPVCKTYCADLMIPGTRVSRRP